MTRYGSVHPALFCDLYELTMAAAYHAAGVDGTASFELFVRSLPPERNFLVAAGASDVIEALGEWTFDDEAIDFLQTVPGLPDDFLARLHGLQFTGEIRAVPEGEVVFAEEPLLEVTAPLLEAQLLETLLLNLVATATMQASKAATMAASRVGQTSSGTLSDGGATPSSTIVRTCCGKRRAYSCAARVPYEPPQRLRRS